MLATVSAPEEQVRFRDDLEALGFRLIEERRMLKYAMQVNRYLTYWVHWDPPERAVYFTWELAIGEFMGDRGLQLGSNEALNSFLFPQHDARGPEELEFVVAEMDRAEQVLRSLDFAEPGA